DAPNTHTILVIDDDPDIRGPLRLALEAAGYDVRDVGVRLESPLRSMTPTAKIIVSARPT
ncbi:MAG: hypothetical protein AAB047_04185, partial [Nitrospirota bacterium]